MTASPLRFFSIITDLGADHKEGFFMKDRNTEIREAIDAGNRAMDALDEALELDLDDPDLDDLN